MPDSPAELQSASYGALDWSVNEPMMPCMHAIDYHCLQAWPAIYGVHMHAHPLIDTRDHRSPVVHKRGSLMVCILVCVMSAA